MPTIEPTKLRATINRERLRELRRGMYLSQRDLAEISGVSATTIANLEHKEGITAYGKTVRRLAQALDVAPDELVMQVE